MGFLRSKSPAPPPPPPPPPQTPAQPVKPQEAEKVKQEMRDPKRVSAQSTIKTGPRGLLEDETTVKKRSLIGKVRGSSSS